MTAVKHYVTIKGIKDGLVFMLDDTCRFTELLAELKHKLETTHQKILSGPLVHVQVKLGGRTLNEADKEEIRELIGQHGNLVIQSIEADKEPPIPDSWKQNHIKVVRGIVRSGQTLQEEESLLLLGDVNPGGTVLSTGDIFILGSLRGMAHAGLDGNDRAVIAASHLLPTQLRIANVVSRPPDEWGIGEVHMEVAYIRDGVMEIDTMNHFHRLRPDK